MIPTSFYAHFPSGMDFSFDLPKPQQEDQQRKHELRRRCEQFNDELKEMAREIKYEGPDAGSWRFGRLQVGRLLDSLPDEVPNKQQIVTRLWGIVSDVEQASQTSEISALIEEARQTVIAKDVKKAIKLVKELEDIPAENTKRDDVAKALKGLKDAIEGLSQSQADSKLTVQFQKLLDKADKLTFQEDYKKAIKAYQECVFWLSRNEIPQKERHVRETEAKLTGVRSKIS